MNYEHILLSYDGPLATLTLNRPELHNAFNAAMIGELQHCFAALASDERARVVILAGTGPSFCAGADINWMRESLGWSEQQNAADAAALAAMYDAAWTLPKPLIGQINGAAIGGGAGLVACCDIAVAVDTARIGFTEVKLGLVPAVISQYVVPKIGLSHTRALMVSGERFTAERAFEIGLIHAITDDDGLAATTRSLARRMLANGPEAIAATKRMLDAVWSQERDAARQFAIDTIARARTGPEGQAGLRAFLEKRRPDWQQ